MKSLKLTESGLKWLKVNIASEFGNDKMSFENQVIWVDSNNDRLEQLDNQADNVFGYRNAVRELRNHENGLDVEYIMPLDCSNQAIQIYGLLSADKQTASMGGISTGEERVDLYGKLADKLNELMNVDIFNRDICKKPLMITLYGSSNGYGRLIDNLKMSQEDFANKYFKGNAEMFEDVFMSALVELVPQAMLVMAEIQSLNDEKIGTYNWTLPDGFKVKYDVKSDITANIKGKTKSGKNFSFDVSSEVYAPSKYNAGMAPNLIHSVDAYILREIVRKMGNSYITTIHDSYSVHPNEVDKLRRAYNEVCIELLGSNLLQDIMCQIAERFVPFDKSNTLTEADVANSVYHLS